MMEVNSDRRPLKTRQKTWVKKFTGLLLKTDIQPDQISILGMVFAILAGLSFYLARQWGEALFSYLRLSLFNSGFFAI